MPRIINVIPEQDRLLFLRCKELNQQIEYAEKRQLEKDAPTTLENFKKIPLEQFPATEQRKVTTAIVRLEREADELAALHAELDTLIPEAECAAKHLKNPKIRDFVRLHCIDGWRLCDVAEMLPPCKNMIYRYLRLLNRPAGDIESEDADDNRADDRGGKGRR